MSLDEYKTALDLRDSFSCLTQFNTLKLGAKYPCLLPGMTGIYSI